MNVKTNTLQNCDFIKLVMMICVVLEHAIAVTNDNWFNLPIQKVASLHWVSWTMDQFHIFVFAMVSGYIFHYLQIERKHYPEYGSFVKTKVARLIVPLLFVSIIWILPVNHLYWDTKIIDSLWLLIEGPSQLWFLYMLFGVYLIGWKLSAWMEMNDLKLIPLMVLLYFVGYVGFLKLPNPFQIWRVLLFLPFFYLGFFLRKNDANGSGTKVRTLTVIWGG